MDMIFASINKIFLGIYIIFKLRRTNTEFKMYYNLPE